MLASVLTTVSSVYPAFLAGALGVELRDALEITERFFGLLIGGFFLGSALGSTTLGRLGERFGARRMITVSLLTTASATMFIALFVRSGTAMICVLFVAGLANSSGQTAANKLLSQSIDPARLGFAMAVKQSGMPGASLLGGLAVPVIALTIGWQWGYALATVLALFSLWAVLRFAPHDGPSQSVSTAQTTTEGKPARGANGVLVSDRSTLILAAVSASSAVDAGWSAGAAGLLLSLGAISGISVRMVLGWQADHNGKLPMRTASISLGIGVLGALLLAPRTQWTHALAIILAFGAGWGWPALFNFAVVRTNPQAASAATGITQTGVYVGVLSGPIVFGFLVENVSYEAGWIVIACSMIIGAAIMARLAPRFAAPS
jgi:MFS family permease